MSWGRPTNHSGGYPVSSRVPSLTNCIVHPSSLAHRYTIPGRLPSRSAVNRCASFSSSSVRRRMVWSRRYAVVPASDG